MGTPANKAGFERCDTANDLGSLKTAFQLPTAVYLRLPRNTRTMSRI